MVQGGLTCKECGGKEICTLSWCWQHKCGVGKIKIMPGLLITGPEKEEKCRAMTAA